MLQDRPQERAPPAPDRRRAAGSWRRNSQPGGFHLAVQVDVAAAAAGRPGAMGADVQDGRPVKSGATTVCLIGAGGRVGHRMIHMPVGFVRMTTGPLTWGRFTAPQRHADTREIPCARARVSGGGSSINAEVFTRGHPSDDDRWEEEGATGWNHAAVHPCFLRSEGNSVLSGPASRGSVTLRSDDPAALPVVDPNVLAEPEGLRVFAEGVKISRDIFGQSSLQR